MSKWIAEESLDAIRSGGVPLRVVVRVGAPYRAGADEWACAVAVDGLQGRLRDVHAGSSLQALCLATSLARSIVGGFVEERGQLNYAGTAEAFDVNACFGGLGGTR